MLKSFFFSSQKKIDQNEIQMSLNLWNDEMVSNQKRVLQTAIQRIIQCQLHACSTSALLDKKNGIFQLNFHYKFK